MNPEQDITEKKVFYLQCITIMSIALIGIRLSYLQILYSDYFFERGQNNFLRIESIRTDRGNIVDCNGKLLATNRPVIMVYWNGTGNNGLSQDQQTVLHDLATIVPTPLTSPDTLLTLQHAERKRKKLLLASDITIEQLSQIKEKYSQIPYIQIELSGKRYYPHQTRASHILGYIRQENGNAVGKTGLELLCNDQLHGQDGSLLKQINSTGSVVTESVLQYPIAGQTIQTTIDVRLQSIGEHVFPHEYTGSLLLFDPLDGSIRALVSEPPFDPGIFVDRISSKVWQALQEKNPFINRACMPYPPGSIFKLVTISAALENGMIDNDETWNCQGFSYFAQRKYWCNMRGGHGTLTTSQAIAQSCNIMFYEIGKKIDIDLLAEYAHKFGLGEYTGILLPEKSGLVPNRLWKLEEKGEQWWPGETLSISIGQSYLLTTPIQVARMIGSIFTGNLVRPRILSDEPVDIQPLDINPQTIDFLQESMKSVITRGTGRRINAIKDIDIFAKTSTAQISAFGKRTLKDPFLEHGWFVAYFRYKDHQPLVLIILIEHAGTSRIPTIIARNFFSAYKKLMDNNDH